MFSEGRVALRIIIVGAGEVGFHLAQWLESEQKDIVLIDKDPEVLKWVGEHLDVLTLKGSGADPETLKAAGVEKADVLLAATDSDEVNLSCCFFAGLLAPKVQKVMLLRKETFLQYRESLIRELKLQAVINPDAEVIQALLRTIQAPEVEEVNDFVGGQIKMIGQHLPRNSPLRGMRIAALPEKYGAHPLVIAAIIRGDRLIVPKGRDSLESGDLVYFVCEEKYLQDLMRFIGWQKGALKNILIVGGGNIGFGRAQALEGERVNVKIIDQDPARCQVIANRLQRAIVLRGNATDQVFLEQENIGQMDLVVAMTRDEEMNILSCLLAKRLGARKTVARVNNMGYISLVQAIGIDHIISPRMAAINSIFPYLHRGEVVTTVSIQGRDAEVLEAVALENSDMVGKALKYLRLPKEALILCLLRQGEVVIPNGDSVVYPGDRVLIISTREQIGRVEQLLAVRGSF
jgi:trk system potassium uptake protein TrkA